MCLKTIVGRDRFSQTVDETLRPHNKPDGHPSSVPTENESNPAPCALSRFNLRRHPMVTSPIPGLRKVRRELQWWTHHTIWYSFSLLLTGSHVRALLQMHPRRDGEHIGEIYQVLGQIDYGHCPGLTSTGWNFLRFIWHFRSYS